MYLLPNIKIIDLTLYLEKEQTLILGDLHLGFEDYLNKQGILVPRTHFKDLLKKLNSIFKRIKTKRTIIAGDLKHEFGSISDQEWNNILKLIDYLQKKSELIIIKGNHDAILKPIVDKRNIPLVDSYRLNNTTIIHGDKLLPIKTKVIIMGHEHPAVSLKRGARTETYKCFLKGRYKNSTLIILPSLNLLTEGANILKEKLLSPYLKNLDDFEVYIIEDKVYSFGKVKDLEKLT